MAPTADIETLYACSDATELARLVRAGEVTAMELAEAAIARIDRLNPRLNAVIHRLDDLGRAIATATDASEDKGALAGVPFLLKELASSWAGTPLTNASRYLRDVVASEDSEAVRRMKAAGLTLLGKSNAPENGWSISTEPVLYGATVNPWDASVTAGGSSGGAAAAVASGMVPIAEASDGAGSIRVPAACCGVVGLKPTRGRVSLAPFADYWAGGAYFLCVSRTVRDTALYLDTLAGGLPGDPYTPPEIGRPYAEGLDRPPGPMRIALVTAGPHGRPVDPGIAAAVEAAGRVLEGLGHAVEPHEMRLDFDALWQAYTAMTCVETAATFDALEGLVGRPVGPEDVEPVTWAIIERGRATSGPEHATLIETVRRAGRTIVQGLDGFDATVTPTLTQPPRPVGFYDMATGDLDAYNALWTDAAYAFPFNVSGQPAISLPLAQGRDGLPIGVQVVGRFGREDTLLRLSAALEVASPWADRRPEMAA